MKHFCLFLVALLGGMSALCAQSSESASFELNLSYDTIGIDELLVVEYTIRNAKVLGQFTPPAFENTAAVMGPSTRSQYSMVNGAVSSSQTYTYHLKPQQVGFLFLPAATVETEVGWLEVQEQTVVVANHPPARPEEENVDPMVQRSPFDHPFFQQGHSPFDDPFFQQHERHPQQGMRRLRELLEQPLNLEQFQFPDGSTPQPTPQKPKKERKTYRI
jgi:hypothetical protein